MFLKLTLFGHWGMWLQIIFLCQYLFIAILCAKMSRGPWAVAIELQNIRFRAMLIQKIPKHFQIIKIKWYYLKHLIYKDVPSLSKSHFVKSYLQQKTIMKKYQAWFQLRSGINRNCNNIVLYCTDLQWSLKNLNNLEIVFYLGNLITYKIQSEDNLLLFGCFYRDRKID